MFPTHHRNYPILCWWTAVCEVSSFYLVFSVSNGLRINYEHKSNQISDLSVCLHIVAAPAYMTTAPLFYHEIKSLPCVWFFSSSIFQHLESRNFHFSGKIPHQLFSFPIGGQMPLIRETLEITPLFCYTNVRYVRMLVEILMFNTV